MSLNSFDYVISGGEEGKSRLNLLSSVLEPTTFSLLHNCGVKPGISFLDCGCGGGNVSMLAANMVGPGGSVTGIDFDNVILQLAKQDAEAEGVQNINFQQGSVYEMDFENKFDIVYSRFLLSHLSNPGTALNKMTEAAKHAGCVVVEDVHFSGHFSYPQNNAFDTYVHWYMQAVSQKGADADIGVRLPGMFAAAGLKRISFDVIQPVFNNGDGKWMAWVTLDRIKDTLQQTGIATDTEIKNTLNELEAFTRNEHSIISMPRIVRVWGYK